MAHYPWEDCGLLFEGQDLADWSGPNSFAWQLSVWSTAAEERVLRGVEIPI